MADAQERIAVVALTKAATSARTEWYRVATLVDQAGSAQRILDRDWNGFEPFDTEEAERLAKAVTPETLGESREMVESSEEKGSRLLTILDEGYPENLRSIYNRPPFLFVRGVLKEQDERAVAVVGTRNPKSGVEPATRLASELARGSVTVLSGLAKGIDTAAHTAALDAGGRTVAVMGTGIDQAIYPRENAMLAQRILDEGGALVSQFWPDNPPTRWSFPMRNVVMSGMAIGTVVIEAGPTSGAKSQATHALDHQKRVFLLKSLVLQEEWARRYVKRGAQVIESVDDILDTLVSMAREPEQLTLG